MKHFQHLKSAIKKIPGISHILRWTNTLARAEILKTPITLEISNESYLFKAMESSDIPCSDLKKYREEDAFYYLFENVFRGSREEIKKRQRYYLQYVLEAFDKSDGELFLDVGCGRGEFLELLKENNIPYTGLDLNEVVVSMLKEKGFNVEKSDILEFLSRTDNKFIGISSFQVIEHLDFDYLKNFIKSAHYRIAHNGVIILESVNPHCPQALSNFYFDVTHIKPYPPETIKFLLEWVGFKDVKIILSAPLRNELRPEDLYKNYQDYAVIGKKL